MRINVQKWHTDGTYTWDIQLPGEIIISCHKVFKTEKSYLNSLKKICEKLNLKFEAYKIKYEIIND